MLATSTPAMMHVALVLVPVGWPPTRALHVPQADQTISEMDIRMVVAYGSSLTRIVAHYLLEAGDDTARGQ